MTRFTEYFSKNDIPIGIVPSVGNVRKVSSKKLVVFHLLGIIHLPHGVVLPVHRFVIVEFNEWEESASNVWNWISDRFFNVVESSLVDVVSFRLSNEDCHVFIGRRCEVLSISRVVRASD